MSEMMPVQRFRPGLTKDEEALIAEHVAAGKVTKIPQGHAYGPPMTPVFANGDVGLRQSARDTN
jgi:hypothetical protein